MQQRHIAFFNIPASGHLIPSLGVVEELVRRGHRVTYAATVDYADQVAAAGATVLPYETTLDPRRIAPTGAVDWLARVLLGAVREARATAPVFESYFADDLPDLLAYDISAQFLGRVLSRKWDRPAVQFYPVFASHQYFSQAEADSDVPEDGTSTRSRFTEFLDELRWFTATHGMADVPLEEFLNDRRAHNIVFMPREFQFDGDSFDDQYTFVGLSLRNADLDGHWEPPASGHPVVVISLGTTYNDQPEFFRTCAQAFADLPWHVVLVAGPRVDTDAVGPLPPNAEIHRWVSLQPILSRASVFVCHGGPGTTMNALYAGAPLVVVPQNGDEEMVAARVSELGLGRVLRPDEVTAERVRDAVVDVNGDLDVRRGVAGMREHVHDAGGASRAADRILAHLKAARPGQTRHLASASGWRGW